MILMHPILTKKLHITDDTDAVYVEVITYNNDDDIDVEDDISYHDHTYHKSDAVPSINIDISDQNMPEPTTYTENFSNGTPSYTMDKTCNIAKAYKCTLCEKMFSCNGNLTKHKVLHTDEKPYSCLLCGMSFRWTFNLTQPTKQVLVMLLQIKLMQWT